MVKVEIHHPVHEKICEFICPDILIFSSAAGVTLVAEKLYTTVRLRLDWEEVETIMMKTMDHLRHRNRNPTYPTGA